VVSSHFSLKEIILKYLMKIGKESNFFADLKVQILTFPGQYIIKDNFLIENTLYHFIIANLLSEFYVFL